MERVVGNHFSLVRRLGAGSFGETFEAENTRNNTHVAVKLEDTKTRVPQLSYESKLYAILAGGTGIPRLFWYGTENFQNILVIELLGKSLEDLLMKCHHRFSLKTVLMLSDQMISCIEYLHQKNFIHRDIKPDNFLIGLGPKSGQVFIIDYGLAKKYRDQHSHKHIPMVEGKPMTGTARYASLAAMQGVEQSRRDDLEALGYVLIYLLRGELPWMGLQCPNNAEKFRRICNMKEKTSFEELCKGIPEEFSKYFQIVRNLDFDEKPNYAELRAMFRSLFVKSKFVYDYKYDWTLDSVKQKPPPIPTKTSSAAQQQKKSSLQPNSQNRVDSENNGKNLNLSSINTASTNNIPTLHKKIDSRVKPNKIDGQQLNSNINKNLSASDNNLIRREQITTKRSATHQRKESFPQPQQRTAPPTPPPPMETEKMEIEPMTTSVNMRIANNTKIIDDDDEFLMNFTNFDKYANFKSKIASRMRNSSKGDVGSYLKPTKSVADLTPRFRTSPKRELNLNANF